METLQKEKKKIKEKRVNITFYGYLERSLITTLRSLPLFFMYYYYDDIAAKAVCCKPAWGIPRDPASCRALFFLPRPNFCGRKRRRGLAVVIYLLDQYYIYTRIMRIATTQNPTLKWVNEKKKV